ncbi:MAG: T9SS type A sorting domain-containing protein, partial [Flavobacterium sp.]
DSPSENVKIELADMSGKTLETIFKGNLASGFQTIAWNVNSKLKAGNFIVKLTSDDKKETFQVVIK